MNAPSPSVSDGGTEVTCLEPTQPDEPTQPYEDDRQGRMPTPMSLDSVADILCILNPANATTAEAVNGLALARSPYVVPLRDLTCDITPSKTMVPVNQNYNSLVLRLSHTPKDPEKGFVFGRNAQLCDILLPADGDLRLSNCHFAIYVKEHGITMLRDSSTNGTWVDGHYLKKTKQPSERLLTSGVQITIKMQTAAYPQAQSISFIVLIPSRTRTVEEIYLTKVHNYLQNLPLLKNQRPGQPIAGTGPLNVFSPDAASPSMTTASRDVQKLVDANVDIENSYAILNHLGSGTYAIVYKVARMQDGTVFAAKEIKRRLKDLNRETHERVMMEMKIMQQISHPHIVQYIEHLQWNSDHMAIIMEYVPNGDLNRLMNGRRGPVSEGDVQTIANQILSALAYLHGENISHRDIKPDNILIHSLQPLFVKLSDFGLSKIVDQETNGMVTFCGTLNYCAPEVYPEYGNYDEHGQYCPDPLRRKRPRRGRYTRNIDIWSLGGVLYHLLTKIPPFSMPRSGGRGGGGGGGGGGAAGAEHLVLLHLIMTTPLNVQPLRDVGASDACIDFIQLMLRSRPEHRPEVRNLMTHSWLGGGNSSQQIPTSQQSFSEQSHFDDEEEEEEEEGEEDSTKAATPLPTSGPTSNPTSNPTSTPATGPATGPTTGPTTVKHVPGQTDNSSTANSGQMMTESDQNPFAYDGKYNFAQQQPNKDRGFHDGGDGDGDGDDGEDDSDVQTPVAHAGPGDVGAVGAGASGPGGGGDRDLVMEDHGLEQTASQLTLDDDLLPTTAGEVVHLPTQNQHQIQHQNYHPQHHQQQNHQQNQNHQQQNQQFLQQQQNHQYQQQQMPPPRPPAAPQLTPSFFNAVDKAMGLDTVLGFPQTRQPLAEDQAGRPPLDRQVPGQPFAGPTGPMSMSTSMSISPAQRQQYAQIANHNDNDTFDMLVEPTGASSQTSSQTPSQPPFLDPMASSGVFPTTADYNNHTTYHNPHHGTVRDNHYNHNHNHNRHNNHTNAPFGESYGNSSVGSSVGSVESAYQFTPNRKSQPPSNPMATESHMAQSQDQLRSLVEEISSQDLNSPDPSLEANGRQPLDPQNHTRPQPQQPQYHQNHGQNYQQPYHGQYQQQQQLQRQQYQDQGPGQLFGNDHLSVVTANLPLNNNRHDDLSASKRKIRLDSSGEEDGQGRYHQPDNTHGVPQSIHGHRPSIKRLRPNNTYTPPSFGNDPPTAEELAEYRLIRKIPKIQRSESGRLMDNPVLKTAFWNGKDPSSFHSRYPEMTQLQYNAFCQAAKQNNEVFEPGQTVFWPIAMQHFPPTDWTALQEAKENTPEDVQQAFDAVAKGRRARREALERVVMELVSTDDSVVENLRIPITQAMTSWGRGPLNTIIYGNKSESRIPKYALKLLVYKEGFDASRRGQPPPWRQSSLREGEGDAYHVYASTKATNGIRINSKHVASHDSANPESAAKHWVRLHHGDVLTVWRSDGVKSVKLEFRCFWGGSSVARARLGGSADSVSTTKTHVVRLEDASVAAKLDEVSERCEAKKADNELYEARREENQWDFDLRTQLLHREREKSQRFARLQDEVAFYLGNLERQTADGRTTD